MTKSEKIKIINNYNNKKKTFKNIWFSDIETIIENDKHIPVVLAYVSNNENLVFNTKKKNSMNY